MVPYTGIGSGDRESSKCFNVTAESKKIRAPRQEGGKRLPGNGIRGERRFLWKEKVGSMRIIDLQEMEEWKVAMRQTVRPMGKGKWLRGGHPYPCSPQRQ